MTALAASLGLLIIALGALGLGSPPRLIDFVSRWQSRRGLYVVSGIRIIFGVVLLLAASDSRAPNLLRVLGVVSLVSGVVTPFFGVDRFGALLGWWSRRPQVFVRLWCVVVVLIGAGVVWAVLP